MELILMRHGTTQGNLERRFIGTLDVPLLPQGEEPAPTTPARRARSATSAAAAPPSCCGPAWR